MRDLSLCTLLITVVWIFYLDCVRADYRYNMRPPQGPPRIPANTHHIKKKWHVPHVQPPPMPPSRMPIRKRIPPPAMMMHNNNNNNNNHINNFKHNIKPMPPKRQIVPQMPIQSTIVPTRPIWKNNVNNNVPFKKPEKAFLSSPPVKTPEYEYHIQTNNIPTHAAINQIDYKGPIHTIPAPKLSPADKPKNIETVKSYERENAAVQIQKAHQYQVTESTDLYGNNNKNHYLSETDSLNSNQDVRSASKSIAPLSTQELFKFFNTYNSNNNNHHQKQQHQQQQHQQHQQSMLENSYTLPLTQQQQQQPQLQQIFAQNVPQTTYQTLVSQTGLFRPETGFVNANYNQNDGTFKLPPFQPEYQTFNFEEEAAMSKQEDQQTVTTNLDYVVTPDDDGGEMADGNPLEALAQTQYVQRFFDTRTDDVNNNVEPDARTTAQNFDAVDTIDESNDDEANSDTSYFTLLPNQKAAETLASLQEAGKRNNNNKQESGQSSIQISPPVPMTIYVPDEYEDAGETDNNSNSQSNKNEGEETDEKDADEKTKTEKARSKNRLAFGNRTKPKSN